MISLSKKAYKSKNRTVIIYEERIRGREMSSDADGRLIKTGMIVHLRERVPCNGCNNWKRPATDRKMGLAVDMMSISEVGDDWKGQPHEPTGLSMVHAQVHVTLGTVSAVNVAMTQ